MNKQILIVFVLCFAFEAPVYAQPLFDSEQTVLAQRRKGKKAAPKKEPPPEEEEVEAEESEGDTQETTSSTLQRGNRMEFDACLIRGETAGSGAVFLFQRAPRALPSMVKTRSSYLSETVQDVLGDKGTDQFEKTKVEVMKEIEKDGRAKSTENK